MEYVLRFAESHPFLSFIIICCMYWLAIRIIRIPAIIVRGWPPEHLDADGDHKGEKIKE